MTSVKHLLDSCGLGQYASVIESSGVDFPTQLSWLSDYQLWALGLTQEDVNTLRYQMGRGVGEQIGWSSAEQTFWSCCHLAAVCSQASSHMAWMASEFSLRAQALSHDAGHDAMWIEPQDASVAERNKILQYTNNAKTKLVDMLDAALESVSQTSLSALEKDGVKPALEYAEQEVNKLPTGKGWAENKEAAKSVHRALQATTRALSVCGKGPLHTQVGEAEKAARNLLVWLVQARSPLDNREVFLATLDDAVGFRQMGGAGRQVFSHMMHAHNLEVASRFPNTFVSNAKRESLKRKGKRPARTRTRQNAGPEAEAYVPADDGGDEEETAAKEEEEEEEEEYVMLVPPPPGLPPPGMPPPEGLHSSSSSFAWLAVPVTNSASVA